MKLKYTFAAIVAVIFCCSCATSPESRSEELSLDADARAARADMIAKDPSIKTAIDKACAHAVFPSVGKGGLVVGGTFGQGVVYQNGKVIGYTSVTAGSVGGTIGGRSFNELILFEDESALHRFKHKDAAIGVEATAVVVTEGSSAQINYHDGVAVIVQQRGGLMADASISGQTFTWTAVEEHSGKPTKRAVADVREP